MTSIFCSSTTTDFKWNSMIVLVLFVTIMAGSCSTSNAHQSMVDFHQNQQRQHHNHHHHYVPDFMKLMIPSNNDDSNRNYIVEETINTIHNAHRDIIDRIIVTYNNNKQQQQQQKVDEVNDQPGVHKSLFERRLQSTPVALNPDDVCQGYNESNETKGILECECARYATAAVAVNCSYIEPQCSDDGTFCFNGYIESIIQNGPTDTVLFNVTTSCSNITTSKTPEYVCIRVFPNENATFSPSIGSCSATYNGNVCSSCNSCIPDPAKVNATDLNKTFIAIDCCNVVTDKIQTCGSISQNGATVQQFDPIPEDKHGQCTSSANHIRFQILSIGTIATLLVSYLML